MHNHPWFKAYKDGELITIQHSAFTVDAEFNPEYTDEIRLFTGMCDSNGEPIYDGDTVIMNRFHPGTHYNISQSLDGQWQASCKYNESSGSLLWYINQPGNTVTLFTERRVAQQRDTVRFIYAGRVLDEANPKEPTRNCERAPIGRRILDDRRSS